MITSDVAAAAASIWRAKGREIVTSFGGTSMRPTLDAGEEVRIECGAAAELGDVILFIVAGRPILHRIVAVAEPKIWTRGDANVLPDGLIVRSDIVGVARVVSRNEEWIEIRPEPRRFIANAILTLCRIFGTRFVAMLWRTRSLAARMVLRLLRPFRRATPPGV